MGLFTILEMNDVLRKLPYQRFLSHGPLRTPDDFTQAEFMEQFRFRKVHFYRILACLKDENGDRMMVGNYILRLKFSIPGHRYTVSADSALLVFLQRMAYPKRWCDIQFIMGSSRSTLSAIFNYMVSFLFDRYAKMITDIRPWSRHFRRFAQHLADWGCPHKNLVTIFDGHFQQTCRPGGDSCKAINLWDFQTFAGKERLHGLKFQAGVMPNG